MKKTLLTAFTLMALGATAQIYPLVTIADIQTVSQQDLANCTDAANYIGDTVRVQGVVIMDGGLSQLTSAKQVWLQDGTGAFTGIDLYAPNANGTTQDIGNMLAGFKIEVTGTIEEFSGETELVPLPGASVSIISSGNTVQSQVVTIADLNDQNRNNILTTGEQWEGVYAELQNVTVSSVDYFSGNTRVSFNVVDANGNKLNVSDRFLVQRLPASGGNFTPPNVGDVLTSIKGVILHSKNNCPGATGRGYELHPFDASHYVYGQSAPAMTNISRNYQVPTSAQAVVVTADITDIDGVASAYIYYAVGATSTNYTQVAMTNVGSAYSATIPAQANGTMVKYYIESTDNTGLTGALPESNPANGTYFYTVRDNGLTIYDVQYTPYTAGNSGYITQSVTVEGVVTASSQAGDLGYVYIQQEGQLAWAGLSVKGNTSLATLKRGDKVSVTGTVIEDFGYTTLGNVTAVSIIGTGTIEPLYLDPSNFTSYGYASNEQYEGMLIGLINASGKLFVVDPNADAPSNFAEYRVGTDQFDPANGCRILAGRQNSSSFSSLNVSYVNDSMWATTAGTMNVPVLVVSDTVTMDTLVGMCYYSFSNIKLIPRNNADFKGINLLPADTTQDTTGSYVGQLFANNIVKLYPNPAINSVTVETNLDGMIYQIAIYDVEGREVFRRITRSKQEEIYTSSLTNGVYFVKVMAENGNTLEVNKLVVNH